MPRKGATRINTLSRPSPKQAYAQRWNEAKRFSPTILMALDITSDLPQTKDTWRVFINAGVSVLEAYATLANGYPKGGAKVAVSHTTAIQQGMFNPAKLWPNEQGNELFRQ